MRYRQSCQWSWLKIETSKILDSTWTPDLHRVYRNTALLADNSKETGRYRKHMGKRIDTDSTYWTISSYSTERCKNTTGAGHGVRSFKSITQEAKAEANGSLWAWDCSTYRAPSQPGLCSQTLSQFKKNKIKKQRNHILLCDVAFHNNE